MALIDAQLSWARILGRRGQWAQVIQTLERSPGVSKTSSPESLYYLSHAYFNLDRFEDALGPNCLALEQEPKNIVWRKRYAATLERCSRFSEAAEQWASLTNLQPNAAEWHFRLAKMLLRLKDVPAALDEMRLASSLDPGSEAYADELAKILRSRKIFWEEVKLRESATFEANPAREHDYAMALQLMNRHEQASAQFVKALSGNSKNPDWLYDAGRSFELAQDLSSANHYYELAIKFDQKRDARRFGIGVFHESRGGWLAAARAYQLKAKVNSQDGQLLYRTALAFDRCFLWEEAAEFYEQAITTDTSVGRWHYKLGLASERLGDWARATQVYSYASKEFGNEYWAYRCGLAQMELGDFEGAVASFENSCASFAENSYLAVSETSEDRNYLDSLTTKMAPPIQGNRKKWFKNRAVLNFRSGQLDESIRNFELAAASCDEHDREIYFLLGSARKLAGDFVGAAEALRETRVFRWQDGIDVAKATQNRNTKNTMEYAEYFDSIEIDEQLVVWQSNGGDSIGCHPLALFEEMTKDPQYDQLKHLWVLNDNSSPIPKIVTDSPNVAFTKRHSDAYRRALASAKYLVNNATFPGYFIRREDQKYLNTWHGTPYKTLGKDMKGVPFKHAAFVRDMLQASHLISPNGHTSSVLMDSHDVRGLYQGRLAELGSPRIDRTLRINASRVDEIRTLLGASAGQKVVLYAPTWRGQSNEATIDVERLQKDLDTLSELDAKVVFRAHRLEETAIKASTINAVVVPPSIDTNELLSVVDALITDYSSIFFDYLPLKRPVVFYMPDQTEYIEQRGLYLSDQELPGAIYTTAAEAAEATRHLLQTEFSANDSYMQALERFCSKEDGSASARTLDFWIHEKISAHEIDTSEDRQIVLFQQSLIPTGMSASFLNLVSKLDPTKYLVVLLVEPRLILQEPGRLETLNRLPDHIRIIGRSGGRVMTPEQAWINGVMEATHSLPSETMKAAYLASYALEFARIFGNAKFNSIVQFDGYVPFWGALLASGGDEDTTRVTYLHNDMSEEWKKRWPNLAGVFRQYESFDKLISVSETMSILNRNNIASEFNVDADKFIACENVINGRQILLKSSHEIDDDLKSIFSKKQTVFVTSGRLSIEKDHRKLIEAFAVHSKIYPQSHLLILGDGPLWAELTQQISKSGLASNVTLAGRRPNPYPYVAAADCFVLPSNHEGQPMVLLEAMVLGKKIVVTDIPGSAHVVKDGYGLIVENSVDGLIQGLSGFESDQIPHKLFDWDSYESETVSSFIDAAGLV